MIPLLVYPIDFMLDLGIDFDVYRTFHGHAAVFGEITRYRLQALAVSIGFAVLARLLKAATLPAALCGGLICFELADLAVGYPLNLLRSPIPALALLFLLTSLATRFRRAKKESAGIAEARTGRRASQVVANLGILAFLGILKHFHALELPYIAAIAALAEATADTLSSEIGQGLAGPAFLVTSLRRVPPGTDGAVSLTGTIAGLAGAALVVLIGLPRPFWGLTPLLFAAIFLAATAGLFFDSLLGATLERRGWIGNDLVNFSSTAFAALASWPLLLLALKLLRV
ncbi:MAG TPA: DUF92 domain-containing protein [Acidobacteriaceae bacterium]|nr:DUF92 domain-containing protein [Acidobacteriaceae bacterium]